MLEQCSYLQVIVFTSLGVFYVSSRQYFCNPFFLKCRLWWMLEPVLVFFLSLPSKQEPGGCMLWRPVALLSTASSWSTATKLPTRFLSLLARLKKCDCLGGESKRALMNDFCASLRVHVNEDLNLDPSIERISMLFRICRVKVLLSLYASPSCSILYCLMSHSSLSSFLSSNVHFLFLLFQFSYYVLSGGHS